MVQKTVDVVAGDILEVAGLAHELAETAEGKLVIGYCVRAEVAALCQPLPFYCIIQLHLDPLLSCCREVNCFIRTDRANNAPWNLRYWGIQPAGPPWDKMQVPQNARNPTDSYPWGSKYA